MDEIKQKVSSLGLQNDVLFLGFRNDINELMQAMDVFVLPSLWEGLPFTLVEAQAAGFLTPALLPAVIFVVSAIMAFATGSSWGTFAICMPIALPLAFNASGNEVTTLVAMCFAAVAGGGVFGDH